MNLSAILATKARPYVLECDGVKYPISHLTQAKKTEFERWLKRQVLADLELEKDFFDGETWQKGLEKFRRDSTSALYSFHGDVAEQALNTPAGGLIVAQILFGQPQEKMLELFAKKGDEVRHLLDLVMAESLPRPAPEEMVEGEGGEQQDPNVQVPASPSVS